jgi:hypothetical protein
MLEAKKEPRSNMLSNIYSVTKFVLPAMVITHLLLEFYQKCHSEQETNKADNDFALAGKLLLCPLYAIAASAGFSQPKPIVPYDPNERNACLGTFRIDQDAPDEGETCISTLKENSFRSGNGIFGARNIEDINKAKSGWWSTAIDAQRGPYKNTFAHLMIINHQYDTFLTIYKDLSLEDIARISIVKDINGRTPLLLSLSIAAPGEVQRILMTKENVIIPDNNGTTPLMLAAAGFTNARTMEHLLCLIGEDRLAQALTAKDKNSKGVEDYNTMSKSEIIDYLYTLEIDANKATDSCFNSFMVDTHGPICTQKTDVQKTIEQEFTMGKTMIGAKSYQCILATQSNVNKIKNLASGTPPQYQTMRDVIRKNKRSGMPEDINKSIWDKYEKISEKLHFSDQSLIQSIMDRQKSNSKILLKNKH